MNKGQVSPSSEPQSEKSCDCRSELVAETVAVETINHLIDAVLSRHAKNEKFKENLKKFSSMKIVTNINEVNSLNFYDSRMNFSTLKGTN